MALKQFAIIETTNPAGGTASITHDPLGGAPDSIKRKLRTLQLDAPPWNHSGRQPYAWEYTAPADPFHGFGVLTVVLAPTVRMLWNKSDWFGEYFGPLNPRLVLIRPQNAALVPPRGAPVLAHQIVRSPYPWASARDDTTAWWLRPSELRAGRTKQSATVVPFENGVMVRHDGGEFELNITAPPTERAAFAYEIIFPQETGYSLRCVHTPNVEISGWLTRDFDEGIPQIFIEHAVVHRIDQVPKQGAVLDPKQFRFEYFTDFKIRLSANTRRVVSVLEGVIGMIPVIGALYDAAQLVYTVATGTSFWGETVALSEDEICVQGLCAILNVALSATEVTGAIKKVIKARPKFAPALDHGVADAVRQKLDQRFLDGMREMSSADRKELVGALNALAAGQLDSRGVLKVANKGLAGKIKTLPDAERVLTKVFSEDVSSFLSSELAEGYARYLAKKRGPRLGPVEWALKQTTGQYAELLRREIGDEFRSILAIVADKNAGKTLTPEALALIEDFGPAVSHYRNLRRKAKGYGAFFEVDHLFEKRFFKSPQLEDAMDQSDFLSMIVAKDPRVAAQIPNYRGYVHSEKTALLRDLIPHGMEDKFTLQQWWDAHIYVGRQVGIPEDVLRGPLKDDFEFLLKHTDTPHKVDFRFKQKPEDFLPQNWQPRG